MLLFFPNTSLSLFPGLSGRDDSVSKRLLSDLPLLIRQSLRDGARSSAFHSARDLRRITTRACGYLNCAERPERVTFRSIASDFCRLKFLAEKEREKESEKEAEVMMRNGLGPPLTPYIKLCHILQFMFSILCIYIMLYLVLQPEVRRHVKNKF